MKRLQNKRVWLGGGAGAALLIIAVAWFMFIGPELSSASALQSQAAATRQQNAVLQAKLGELQVKSSKITKYTASLKAALSALPYDSGLPAFTRQLSAQARVDEVAISGVVVGSVSAVVAAAPAVGGVAPAVAGAAPAAPAPATPTDTTGATPTTPIGPTSAAGSLYSVLVTIESKGTLVHQLGFLHDVRTAGPRRVLITSSQIVAGAGKGGSIDRAAVFTTQLTIFSAPQSPAQVVQLNKLLSNKIGH